MTESTNEMHPSPRAIGILWLVYVVVGIPSLYLLKGIVVTGAAVATAQNILAHPALFQASASIDLVANALYIALTACLYGLFRPVNRSFALTAAFFSLTGCIVQIVAGLLRIVPPIILGDAHLASAFTAAQLQSSVMLGLALYSKAFFISFPLFALFELVTGYLMLKSTFVPRWLGVWWVIAGVFWLIFLWPPLAVLVQRYIIALGGPTEIAFAVWLIVKGNDAWGRRQMSTA
ncbi:MAG: DUF4386 domain-containing protein [Gemmatimonadaceae bacterium]